MATKKLEHYHQKRNFKETPEPRGKAHGEDNHIFVIQKHDATALHYDFRLEIDGVLKSWAVPKGPSLDPSVKRLAIPTEDHPMEYAQFEGVIPEGQYGAGPVMIWDYGTYENIKEHDGKIVPMDECYEQGTIEVWLDGHKLHGGFALIAAHIGDAKNWLLIKMDDDQAHRRRNPVNTQNKSAVTDRTMHEIENADKNIKK